MNRSSVLATAGGVTFLVFLVAGVPATVALRWVGPKGLQPTAVSGSLWHGSAAALSIGKLRLGETSWSLSPARLLLGRLAGDVTARLGDGTAQGFLSIGLAGGLACTGCSYEGPVAGLRPLVPALRNLEGALRIDVPALKVAGKWPNRAVASAKLTGVPFGAPGESQRDAPLAAFELSMNADPVPENGLIEALVQDAGGPLELHAKLTVTPPGNFELNGRAKARPGAPPDMTNALAMLGPRGADGGTDIVVAGTF